MSQLSLDEALINYQSYRFGRRQRLYRGPMPDLGPRYIAFLGAEQTFGKFVNDPYPAQVEKATGTTALNLGVEGTGPGFFLNDPEVLEACCRAELCVLEITSAWNLSNRLYSVGRRYNRRLRSVSETMRGLYPEVDFESFDFIGRMLEHIHAVDPDKFAIVEKECRAAWVARMRLLLEAVETRTILLWFSERRPDEQRRKHKARARLKYPDAVDMEMLEEIIPHADAYVECVAPNRPSPFRTLDGQMIANPNIGRKASRYFPSQEMHDQAAAVVTEQVKAMLVS